MTKPSRHIRSRLLWCHNSLLPVVIRQCLSTSYFTIVDETNRWIGYWGRHLRSTQYRSVLPYQKVFLHLHFLIIPNITIIFFPLFSKNLLLVVLNIIVEKIDLNFILLNFSEFLFLIFLSTVYYNFEFQFHFKRTILLDNF